MRPRAAEQEEARPSKGDVRLHVDLKRAQKAAEHGDQAEAEGHIDQALLYYQEATYYAPRDARYIAKEAALRSKLVRSHVDVAEKAALEGRMEKATEELRQALHIDPGNTVVAERLTQMNSMEDEPPTKEQLEMTGLPKLQPKSGKQDLDLRGETKSVYEELGARFGIKASFDPDVAGRQVRLRVENVDFYTALMLLGTQTGTFWRALNPTLIFVAPDTPQKRKDYAPEGQQVFPLPASVAPDEMTELLRVLRDITGATHVELDTRSRTITMRDTPERLAVAGQLIHEVEKARGEVLLDIELLEVDRTTMQKLGVTPPTSASLIYLTPNMVRTSGKFQGPGEFTYQCAANIPGARILKHPAISGGGRRIVDVSVDDSGTHAWTFRIRFHWCAADEKSCCARRTTNRRRFLWETASRLRCLYCRTVWAPAVVSRRHLRARFFQKRVLRWGTIRQR